MLVSKLVLDRIGYRADRFFKTDHTSYYRFTDGEVLTVTSHDMIGAPVGMAGVPFVEAEWILIERTGFLTDLGFFEFEEEEIFDPKVERIIPSGNSEKYLRLLKEVVNIEIEERILERLRERDYLGISGLGPGLTPLGDDVLSGMISVGLRIDRIPRTSEISTIQLRYALRGLVPYPVKVFLEKGEDDILMRMGATSGIGWAFGITFFLETEG